MTDISRIPMLPGNDPLRVIGSDIDRSDAPEKTTGQAVYTTDITLPGMLHAKALRSPHAHARLLHVDAAAARSASGIRAVLTRDDIPPHLQASFGFFIKDQPIVARDVVRHVGDIIAVVAAESEAEAVQALAMIVVHYQILPIAANIEDALAPGAPELFPDPPPGIVPSYGPGARGALRPAKNICYEFGYRTGDENAFARCDHVFSDEFRFSRMVHFHLEPYVSVVQAHTGRIDIWSACQNPFGLRKEMARIFRLPENAVSVKVPYVGGGFGSKNNCRTEPAAALLSQMAGGRPVRFCLSMEEGFFTNTQHAAILRLRTGVMQNGQLVARQSEILLDAGAYSDASPLVSEKAAYRVGGPYRYEFIDSVCRCVMTNTAPAGAYRGFGGTQASWASESQIDMIARRLGIDPLQMRQRNLLNLGEAFVPGESGIDSDMREGLDLVCHEIGYHQPRRPNHGIGISVGFKDGGGVNKPAQARVKISTFGDVFLQSATIEIGQGSATAFRQIVAEILHCPVARVCQMPVDTDTAPFDQGTNASSGIAVMGQAIASAARAVRAQVLAFAAERLQTTPDQLDLEDWTILRGNERIALPRMIIGEFGGTGFEFSGDGFHKARTDHHAPLEAPCVFWEIGWGAAEIVVDTETGLVTVLKLVVSGDAGRIINPRSCRGQDDGAALMGLGQALFERMLYDKDGKLLNGDVLDYRVPLAEDLPEYFRSITQQQGHGRGRLAPKAWVKVQCCQWPAPLPTPFTMPSAYALPNCRSRRKLCCAHWLHALNPDEFRHFFQGTGKFYMSNLGFRAHYRFIPGPFQYSAGVVSKPGHYITRIRFASPIPLAEGFTRIASFLAAESLPLTAFCACELRSPAPFSDAGFVAFNRHYVGTLAEWGILNGDENPVARSNVCPEIAPPATPSFHAFSFVRPGDTTTPSFVVSGSAEAREGAGPYREKTIRYGETTPAAIGEKLRFVVGQMEQRMAALGVGWAESTATQVYSVHDYHPAMATDLVACGAAAAGITWHFCRPPVVGLEYEMDCRGVAQEAVIPG